MLLFFHFYFGFLLLVVVYFVCCFSNVCMGWNSLKCASTVCVCVFCSWPLIYIEWKQRYAFEMYVNPISIPTKLRIVKVPIKRLLKRNWPQLNVASKY